MPGYKRKRGKDAWYLEVTIGTDFTGKPIRFSKTVHCKSEKEAEKELARFYVECEDGRVSRSASFTVSAMCGEVIDMLSPNLKKTTLLGYGSCKHRIDETIGSLKATKATPKHVQEWVNQLTAQGYSPKTVKNTYSFLRMCYQKMMEWGTIEDTPCRFVKLPKQKPAEPVSLDKEQLLRFIEALDTVPKEKQDYKVSWMLAFMCGLRRGEICGLNEDDIDLTNNELHVRRTRNIDVGGIYEDSPKSATSVRQVAFPEALAVEIRKLLTLHKEWRLKAGQIWQGSPALIKGETGGPIYPILLGERLASFCEENDLPRIRMHSLRHTHASMMKWMGYDLLDVSAQLGHSQKSTTLNIYSHLFENHMDRSHRMADRLQSEFLSAAK